MIKSEYWYKLADFYLQNEGGNWIDEGDNDQAFSDITSAYGLYVSALAYDGYSATYEAIMDEMWEILRNKYVSDYCYRVQYSLHETEQPLTRLQCREMLQGFINLFNMTMPRYLPLLKAYQDNAATPIQKVESTSTGLTRFNDTPQDGGDFDDDSHTTNLTNASTTTQTDPAALYEQLDHLYKNWRSILRDWSDEFDGLFVSGDNII